MYLNNSKDPKAENVRRGYDQREIDVLKKLKSSGSEITVELLSGKVLKGHIDWFDAHNIALTCPGYETTKVCPKVSIATWAYSAL